MSIKTSEGTGQQVYTNQTFAKPFIPRNGQYNPETFTNSALNMYNKRLFQAPTNYIGFQTLRPDNMYPNRQHTPMTNQVPNVPILTTEPIPKLYH